MNHLHQCLLALFSILLLGAAGCATIDSVSRPQSFFLPHSFENYQSAGRVLLVTPDQKIPGELEFSLSGNLELRIQFFTPLIGSLVYEIRANPDQFMILDFQEKQYILDQNVSHIRQEWLGIDISLIELSWVIWGRMPQEHFQQRQGERLSSETLRFVSEEAVFVVTLGPNGIMRNMLKSVGGIKEYEVTIRKFQEVAGKFYPRVIQMIDHQNQGRLNLVMNDITPAISQLPALIFLPAAGMTPYPYK